MSLSLLVGTTVVQVIMYISFTAVDLPVTMKNSLILLPCCKLVKFACLLINNLFLAVLDI